ncbi:Protein disulfide-isomerase [Gryllus bimaculatus]|nr:Protein disulfide-isomerase [Gryllus bimaculatus]
MYISSITFFLFVALFHSAHLSTASRVLELSDRFLDIKKDGQWLIMFYAPWCAHCKRLEPIWAHVAQALRGTSIRVGRVDCTRFTSVATEFSVSGFPTIMFLKDDVHFTFRGDRTKDEIVNFALRVSGPPVQHITKLESLDNIKANNPLFFLYVGDSSGSLWEVYSEVAEKFQPHGFFYSTGEKIAKNHAEIKKAPTVFVFKETVFYEFEDDVRDLESQDLNSTMFNWINAERFETFPKVTRGNIHQILQTGKYLVLAVVEENKLLEVPPDMIDFRDMVESVIRKNKKRLHKNFQFGWVGSPELANSIAMSVLTLPHLLVVNSTTNHHHLPQDEPSQLTPEAVEVFLDQIHNQSAPAYGGNTLPVRLYRTYFEARTSLSEMWQGNPVLTAVLFGLPLGFLSLICYSICCADIMDAEDEEEDVAHEKKE